LEFEALQKEVPRQPLESGLQVPDENARQSSKGCLGKKKSKNKGKGKPLSRCTDGAIVEATTPRSSKPDIAECNAACAEDKDLEFCRLIGLSFGGEAHGRIRRLLGIAPSLRDYFAAIPYGALENMPQKLAEIENKLEMLAGKANEQNIDGDADG